MIPSKRFLEALEYAFNLHAGQCRKGTEIPYLAHLLAVCSLVMEHGGDEEEAMAALLHDVVEDQGGEDTLNAVEVLFGERVSGIVKGCTDSFTDPKPPWKDRKIQYLKHLKTTRNRSIRLVSAADKLHNARAIVADYRELGEALWKRFKVGRKEQLWYYGELVKIFRDDGPRRLGEELARAVDELKKLTAESP